MELENQKNQRPVAMETRDATASPPDDGGLWMKLDSTETPAAGITRYYSVMDDKADVFILPPPPPSPASPAPLQPAEGSSNSSVTSVNRAADATEAEANPSSLDRLHCEKQLMAAQVDVATAGTAPTSEESMDTVSQSNTRTFTPQTDQHLGSVEGSGSLMNEECHDPLGRKDRGLKEQQGENPNQTPSDTQTSDTEGESNSNLTAGNTVGPNAPTSYLSVDKDDFQTCESPALHKNKTDEETKQVPDNSDDHEQVDTRSLNYNLTKNDWVKRDSEAQVLQLSVSKDSEEVLMKAENGDGSKKIASDIQQGEKLLQRLQLVQQRQDGHVSDSTSTSQERETDVEKAVCGTEGDFLTPSEDDLTPKESSECKEQSENQKTSKAEPGNSDDGDQSDSWVSAHSSPINSYEASTTAPSARHRFSAAETSVEIQEAAQAKQNLQRAGGVYNLTDNPDMLEIPFQTNIVIEPFPSGASLGRRSDWQFSEQKMQKEISQEIQRELVLVNQGKIPGGYSKGEVRQLKETKLLFEAFREVTTEVPMRHRKPPTLAMKGHVYPSVLERTRSLEMFSIKSCPVSRAHSLKLYKTTTSELEKSTENFRSRSPSGGSREKTRLSPYPKQVHMHRSIDSLSSDVSTSAVDTRQSSPILKQNPFVKLRPSLALKPEVEKDIREAKQREEELRRQRCTLYGESRPNSEEEEKSRLTKTLRPDDRQQSTGKLERVWPPPSERDQKKSEQQQEPRGHKAPLWQRWESGRINGQPPQEND